VRVLSQHGLEIGETGTLTSSKLSLPPHQDGRKKETLKQKKIRKFFRSLSQLRYHIFWVLVWLGINAGLFFYAARNALLDGWNAFTIYTALGNGGGLVLCFDVAFLVVPMCRNLLTYLRTTWLHRFVPFDSSIEFHKILGW
jgi:hypothetical protein